MERPQLSKQRRWRRFRDVMAIAASLVTWAYSSSIGAQTTDIIDETPIIEDSQSLGSEFTTFRLIHTIKAYKTPVQSLGFAPQGRILVSGGSTNEPIMRFWSVTDGREIGAVRAQSSAISALAVVPNGETVVTSGEDEDIHFWDLKTRRNKAVFLDHTSDILALVVTPDSRIAVSGGLDGIRVWTVTPSRFLYQLTDFGDTAYAMALHPNGYILASGNERGRVRFWNIREAQLISQFFPHQETITGLVITPDGKQLISASQDRTIKVWDIASGDLIYTFEGHTNTIRAIALSPDGRLLASSSDDGIRIWNLPEKRLFKYFTYPKDWVQALAFSSDGRYLASGDFAGMINLWEIEMTALRPIAPTLKPETEPEKTPIDENPVIPSDDIIIEEKK